MARKHWGPHSHGGYEGSRLSNIQMFWMLLAAAGFLCIAFVGIWRVGEYLEADQAEIYGDLEGRFKPTLTLEWNGKSYAHQELDYTTLLFIGVDKPTLETASFRSGGQADFLLLMTVDRKAKQVHTLQIDRDTVADIQVYGAFGNPAGTRKTQICLSYAFGADPERACENTVTAVTNLLEGIPIDHYIAMDMEGMSVLNDALGGVTVTLEDDFSDLDQTMTPGKTVRLQGEQAEYFLRSRMAVGDGTNKARMNRQAAFMSAAMELLKEKMAGDAEYINSLLKVLEPHLITSCEGAWLVNQAYTVSKYDRLELERLEGEHTVGADGFIEFHLNTDVLMEYIVNTFCE